MANFILVHGAWQGGWCWSETAPSLRARGHAVTTPDLPGHGADTAPRDTLTLEDYVDALVQGLGGFSEPPILVGHSMGGLIMRAAEAAPERIRALVYISATLPANGTTMLQIVEGFDPAYLSEIVWAADRRTALISPEGARTFLYPQCPQRIAEQAIARLTPEPVTPFETPVSTTAARLGRVPAYYIECLQDRAVPIALQRKMQAGQPLVRTLSLDADHSPFFSAPGELVECLHTLSVESSQE